MATRSATQWTDFDNHQTRYEAIVTIAIYYFITHRLSTLIGMFYKRFFFESERILSVLKRAIKKETVFCVKAMQCNCNRTSNTNFMIILYRTDLSRLMCHEKLQVPFSLWLCTLQSSFVLHNWMTLDALISFNGPSLIIIQKMGHGLSQRWVSFLCFIFVDWRKATNCTDNPLIISIILILLRRIPIKMLSSCN